MTSTYAQEVLDAVAARLHQRLANRDHSALGPPDRVAERMLATVPVTHPWDNQIGPFYDTAGVAALLGIRKQAIADRVRRYTLLAAYTAQGKIVYPAWQFDGAHLNPAISRTVAAFRHAQVDGWAIASWFTTPARSLNGATPAAWLRTGDPEPVLALAHDTSGRWAPAADKQTTMMAEQR